MDSLNDILNTLKAKKEELHQKYNVSEIGIMGSFARGEATPQSDIDVLVSFDGPIGFKFIDLADELETLLARPVDLISRRAIRPQVWQLIEQEVIYA